MNAFELNIGKEVVIAYFKLSQVFIWSEKSHKEYPEKIWKKKNSMVRVRERTIPTERSPLAGEVIVNFLRIEGATWSA
jgi:hypothetical protein